MDTIVVFSVWASNTLKLHFWMTHAPGVGAYEHDFAAISPLFSKKSGILCPVRSMFSFGPSLHYVFS